MEHDTLTLELDVGGIRYATTKTTLGDLFEHPSVTKQPHGRFFIDRDGKLFRYVLQFLRDGDIRDTIAGMKAIDIPGLKREAFFFDLGPLKEQISEVESAIALPIVVWLDQQWNAAGHGYHWAVNSRSGHLFDGLQELRACGSGDWPMAIGIVVDAFATRGYEVVSSQHNGASRESESHELIFRPQKTHCSRADSPLACRLQANE
jgi:hypothetical protein